MSGHVFVLAGDLTALHCDAVLVPTDAQMQMSGAFGDLVDQAEVNGLEWPENSQVMRVGDVDRPQIWLADVGRWRGADPSSYRDVVDEYARRVAAELHRNADDPPPVLALPVIGTAEGGFDEDKGAVYGMLLPAMDRASKEHGVDVALVCWGRKSYAAAQRTRRLHLSGQHSDPSDAWDFGERNELLRARAMEVADHAVVDNLVLFLGAGVSAGAGLPLWQELLDGIASHVGLDESELSRLHRLDVRDQAAILHRRMKAVESSLSASVVDAVSASGYSITHGLLASLRSREAVTTNYDRLFEEAVAGAQQSMAVLPYESVARGERWLLKLHGSVDQSDSIVLTRDDYLGVPASHGALFGLVQALLLTRHMLFVGYSLSDEDFHQLVHEVRQARPGVEDGDREASRKLGTAITLFDDPLLEELWTEDLAVVAMADRPPEGLSEEDRRRGISHAERRLRIFLDLVAFESADLVSFLLDPTFDSMLDPTERSMARGLRRVKALAAGGHPAQRRLDDVLSFLDAGPPSVGKPVGWGADLAASVSAVCPPGSEIRTLGTDQPNWIVDIRSDGILVHTERSKANGDPQLVPGWMVQVAVDHIVQFGAISNRYLVAADGLNVKRSSFVCAVLSRLSGITVVSRDPIVLVADERT